MKSYYSRAGQYDLNQNGITSYLCLKMNKYEGAHQLNRDISSKKL